MEILFIPSNIKVLTIFFASVFLLACFYNIYKFADTGGTTNYPRRDHSPQWLEYRACRQHFIASVFFGVLGLYLWTKIFPSPGLFIVGFIFTSIGVYIVTRNYFTPMSEDELFSEHEKSWTGTIEDVG